MFRRGFLGLCLLTICFIQVTTARKLGAINAAGISVDTKLGEQRRNADVKLTKGTARQSSPLGVRITAGDTGSTPIITAYGADVHVISDEERSTFGIQDDGLKQAVEHYAGKSPNDAFVRGPTPWDDLYTTYDWQQVTTTVVPIHTEVLGISTESQSVVTKIFENNSTETVSYQGSISESVTNSVTSSWSHSGSVTLSQTIKYGVEFLGTGGGGESSISLELGWGIGGSETETVTLSSTSGVRDVTLDPGEAVKVTLMASRSNVKLQVKYRTTLGGLVACNYADKHNDHHFWAYDVNNVLAAGGLERENIATTTLDLDYYSNSHIIVSDHYPVA